MKKTSMLFLFGVTLMVFSSCKKDRVCECTTSPSNTTDKYTLVKVTKKQAKDICTSKEADVDVGGSTVKVTMNCTLK